MIKNISLLGGQGEGECQGGLCRLQGGGVLAAQEAGGQELKQDLVADPFKLFSL